MRRGSFWTAWSSGGLVVAGEVKGEVSQELPGCGVDDPDVEVLYEQDDGGSGMGSADPDVEEVAADAQGDLSVGVDHVTSETTAVMTRRAFDTVGRCRTAYSYVLRDPIPMS